MEKRALICSEEEGFLLLDQLERILEHDPLIDELGFIHPTQLLMLKEEEGAIDMSSSGRPEADERLSFIPSEAEPVEDKKALFWSREHKLGISTDYLLPLYKAAKRKFRNAYMAYQQIETMARSFTFSDLENEVMKHSKALLLLSSDFGTAWNARKLIISKREEFSISDELLVSALVLSFAPKSESAWNYRRWVIKKIVGRSGMLEGILENESKIVEKIAEKSKMNYRAWNHRCWLIPFMTSQQVLHELNTNRNWATLHVADSSCFHYRRTLMSRMLDDVIHGKDPDVCSTQLKSLQRQWKDELDWNEVLIRRYIGREALWLHRRFLSVCWGKHLGVGQPGISQHSSEKGDGDGHLSIFIDGEVDLLQDCLSLPDSMFEDVQSQIIHAAAYMLCLNREICSSSKINLNEKLQAGDLRTLLNKVCPEKTKVWDCLLFEQSL